MSRPKLVSFLVAVVLMSAAENLFAMTITTFNYPSAPWTTLEAVSGNNVVGYYLDSNVNDPPFNFVYNGSTFTPISGPSGFRQNYAEGIYGNTIVGLSYPFPDAGIQVQGFLYNGSGYTLFQDPLGSTYARAISGSNIVGFLQSSSDGSFHGFLYNGSTYTTIDDPLSNDQRGLTGIDGNNVVGIYVNAAGTPRSFLYNGSTFTPIDDPLGVNGTEAQGISGNNIVGYYLDALNQYHGFLYNGSTYTTIDDPFAGYGNAANTAEYADGSRLFGISGDTIVGNYFDASTNLHGFIVTIPEPSSILLLALGAGGLWVVGRHRRRQAQPR
jgi:hypothetical protein